LRLSISGNVDRFAAIAPRQVRLRGFVGEPIKEKVTIIPEEKYPFKILKAQARDGRDIRFQLEEVNKEKRLQYALIVENQRDQTGRYFDVITLETDSAIKPRLDIRVYGDLMPRPEEKNKSQ
jgi:hypothetical protein